MTTASLRAAFWQFCDDHAVDMQAIARQKRVAPDEVINTAFLVLASPAATAGAVGNLAHWALAAVRLQLDKEMRPTGWHTVDVFGDFEPAALPASAAAWRGDDEHDEIMPKLAGLPPRLRHAATLVVAESLTTAQLADRLGVTARRAQQLVAEAAGLLWMRSS